MGYVGNNNDDNSGIYDYFFDHFPNVIHFSVSHRPFSSNSSHIRDFMGFPIMATSAFFISNDHGTFLDAVTRIQRLGNL